MSDLSKRGVEGPRTARARIEAAPRWCVLAPLEVLDQQFVVSGNPDIDRKAQATVWAWVRREIANDPRTCSKWMAGDDRGALRVGARRDGSLERQEANYRCGQG
jgi:hypothetical protein